MRFFKLSISLALLAFCLVQTVQAQVRATFETQRPAVWSLFAGEQMARSLASPSAEIRTKALEHLILLARTYGEELDLSEAVPALVTIYNEDPDEQCRLAAAVGLHALGDEGGLQQMRLGLARQTSKRVQHVAIAALADTYGLHTFEGAEDVGAIVREVMAYYEAEREILPFIASDH